MEITSILLPEINAKPEKLYIILNGFQDIAHLVMKFDDPQGEK